MREALSIRLTLVVILGLYGYVFQQFVGVIAIAVLLAVSFFPLRTEVDRIGQIIVALFCMVGAYVLASVIGPRPKHPISDGFALVQASVCVWTLLVCCTRLYFRSPWMGHRGTVLFALIGLFAGGGNKIGVVYHVFVILFTVLALWAMAEDDPARPGMERTSSRRLLLLVGAWISMALVSLSLFFSLPKAYEWANQQFQLTFFPQMRATGFSTYFRLGSLGGLLQSDRMVMRVSAKGGSVLRLRGAVYTRYYRRYWLVARDKAQLAQVDELKNSSIQKGELLIEYMGASQERYFLPLGSSKLAVPDKKVKISRVGVVYSADDKAPERIRVRLTKTGEGLRPDPPSKDDLQMPKTTYAAFRAIAKRWTKGAKTPREQILALKNRFVRRFTYSLQFKRPKSKEPMLDFLLKNRQGHCEYFASGMALLARSLGFKARVVGGYLVHEYNEYGNYYIVRERNAHAWNEIWLPSANGKGPGRWETWDATPPDGLSTHMPKKASPFAAISDLIRVWLSRLRERIVNMSTLEMVSVISFFALLWLGLRIRRYLRERKEIGDEGGLRYDDPLPAFEAFMGRLQQILSRKESETLERYAERLQDDKLPTSARQAANILLAYASFRYGQVGDPDEIVQQMNDWVKEQAPVLS